MLHIVQHIRRRYPERGDAIVAGLLIVSGVVLALGVGLVVFGG